MPLRRAVSRVKHLPETAAWAGAASRDRAIVQYVLSLDQPKYRGGQCYWPVEVRFDGRLWKRFLVTPDGSRVMEDEKS